jgi:hypothetical protein
MKTKFYDASGQQVDASTATDERGVIRHGFSIRTSMLMMDSETRDPFKPLTDDAHPLKLPPHRGQQRKVVILEAGIAGLAAASANPHCS